MRALLKIRTHEFAKEDLGAIISHLDRIQRNRVHYRHKNSKSMLYTCIIKKLSSTSFTGHLGGPDTEKRLGEGLINIKFTIKLNQFGKTQIVLHSTDNGTSREQAINLIKHALKYTKKKLKEMPYNNEEFNTKTWNGFYLKYSGDRPLFKNFSQTFNKAIEKRVFPADFKISCKEFGFNIVEH